jgi:hypothetical protein
MSEFDPAIPQPAERAAARRRAALSLRVAVPAAVVAVMAGLLMATRAREEARTEARRERTFQWPQTHSLVREPGPSTVFAWDEHRLGLLNPNAWEIELVGVDAGRASSSVIRLERPPKAREREVNALKEIFPDVVQRAGDGKVYWLSRSRGRVLVFSDAGRFLRVINTELNQPFWMRVREGDRVDVFGTRCDTRFSGYRQFDAAGTLVRETMADASCTSDDASSRFFFGAPEQAQVEVFARHARLRVVQGGHADLRALQSPLLPARWRGAGSSVAESSAMGPKGLFALAADRDAHGNVFILINGGVLLKTGADAVEAASWRIPAVDDARGVVQPTSLSITGEHLAILTQEPAAGRGGQVRLRIWKMS